MFIRFVCFPTIFLTERPSTCTASGSTQSGTHMMHSISHRTFILQLEVFSFHLIMLQCGEGHVIAKMVSCQTVTVEVWVQSQTSPCDIVVDKVASPKAAVYPVSIIPSVLHTYSLIYHRCFIMLALTVQLHDTQSMKMYFPMRNCELHILQWKISVLGWPTVGWASQCCLVALPNTVGVELSQHSTI
jgi:hypothetical protein